VNDNPGRNTRRIVFAVLLTMAVLHHDFWLWNDPTLVFGFLPAGLAYHAFFSILAACVWGLVVKFAWPHDVEELAETPVSLEEGSR
jgi:hypothetical protein